MDVAGSKQMVIQNGNRGHGVIATVTSGDMKG